MEQKPKFDKKKLIILITSCVVVAILILLIIFKKPSFKDVIVKNDVIPTDSLLQEEQTDFSEATDMPEATSTAEPTDENNGETPATNGAGGSGAVKPNGTSTVINGTRPEYALSGEVPECPRVSSSYFDDVVFIGDSVTLALKNYNSAKRTFGNAAFLAAGSFGSGNALGAVTASSTHPKYNGTKYKLEDSVPLTGKKRVYIMLGMNDLGVYGVDGSVRNLEKVCDKIIAKAPYVWIYIQSMTPKISAADNPNNKLSNKNIALYNQKLNQLCINRGWYFVNVASVMYNENGALIDGYCSDRTGMGLHFNQTGCQVWADYLYTHAVSTSSVKPTPTPTPNITPTPEVTPTPEITPTPEVTPTPEITPTPEATEEPTPTPEVTPEVSEEPTSSPS